MGVELAACKVADMLWCAQVLVNPVVTALVQNVVVVGYPTGGDNTRYGAVHARTCGGLCACACLVLGRSWTAARSSVHTQAYAGEQCVFGGAQARVTRALLCL
jgi:hypothetical protein